MIGRWRCSVTGTMSGAPAEVRNARNVCPSRLTVRGGVRGVIPSLAAVRAAGATPVGCLMPALSASTVRDSRSEAVSDLSTTSLSDVLLP